MGFSDIRERSSRRLHDQQKNNPYVQRAVHQTLEESQHKSTAGFCEPACARASASIDAERHSPSAGGECLARLSSIESVLDSLLIVRRRVTMNKTIISLTALVLGGLPIGYTSAQDFTSLPPKASVQEYVKAQSPSPSSGPSVSPSTAVKSALLTAAAKKAAAGTCGNPAGPCLFYGGDYTDNPLYPPFLQNGLANESDLLITGSPYGGAVWVPFTVPEGKGWKVKGMFTNNQSTYGVLDQTPNTPISAAYYAVAQGVGAGNPGVLIAAGTAEATSTPTGRAAFGEPEYTVQVTGLSFELAPGDYWMAVVPLCTNTANPLCDGRFFLSDVEYINTPPANAYGPAEPVDDAYLDGAFFGLTFDPTYSEAGAGFGDGCDAFSAGILGTEIKGK
jgi:hypothetical protein